MKTFWKPFFLLLGTFITFFIVVLIYISVVKGNNFFLFRNLGHNLTDLISLLSLCVSVTAFSSIYFSLNESKVARSNELKQTTIDLFKEFRSERFRKVTTSCWDVKAKWDKNLNDYRNKLIIAMFDEVENKEPDINITSEQIQAIYDFLGFYTILSLYRDNNDDIQKLNYFYYGWWRKFLYELAEKRDEKRIENLFTEDDLLEKNVHYNRSEYIENNTLRPILKRLDDLCGFQNIIEDLEFHRSGG